MPRKIRSDKTVGSVEKDLGLSTGVIRNEDGRDTRSDKKLGTIRKEQNNPGFLSSNHLAAKSIGG